MLQVRQQGGNEFYALLPANKVPAHFIKENGSYELILDVEASEEEKWEYEVICNDVPLQHLSRKGQHFFPLTIDFYAGEISVTIQKSRKIIAQNDVVVDPEISKATRAEYQAMLKDIASDTLSLFRLGQTTAEVKSRNTSKRLNLATLELVKIHLPKFLKAVSHIDSQPIHHLTREPVTVPIHRASKVTSKALFKALTGRGVRPATPSEEGILGKIVSKTEGYWIDRVSIQRCTQTTDIYENRALLGFITWLDSKLLHFLNLLLAASLSEIPKTTVDVWVQRLRLYRGHLARLKRLSLFEMVSPVLGGARSTSIFAYHPQYSVAFKAMKNIQGGLDAATGTTINLPLDKTFRLYESWCYLRLLKALTEEFPEYKIKFKEFVKEVPDEYDLGKRLLKGAQTRIPLGPYAHLVYQREYNPSELAKGHPGTVAIDAIPDFVLEHFNDLGFPKENVRSVIIVDAKYRTNSALFDAIRSMHVYRDAIVGPTGNRLVIAAVILAPYKLLSDLDASSTEWQAVTLPERMFFTGFRSAYQIGAISVRPGADIATFKTIAKEIVAIAEGSGESAGT